MLKKSLFVPFCLLLSVTSATASTSCAKEEGTSCQLSEAQNAEQRAEELSQRNTFLNTKFPRSESAPEYHREKARQFRNSKQS